MFENEKKRVYERELHLDRMMGSSSLQPRQVLPSASHICDKSGVAIRADGPVD